jgi:Protein of unknown function (DUF2950)
MEKELMRTNYRTLETFTVKLACGFASGIFCLLLVVLLLLVAGFAGSSFAQDSQPKTFSSPGEASGALFQAVQNEDEPSLEAILGAGKEVTSSSDEVQDKLEREKFCQKYREMRRLVREADGTTVLYIGAENWPFPIPLVSKNGAWYFDSKTGIQEIKFRRVGENEATAIEICSAFAMAKKQGETKDVYDDDFIRQYVVGLVSASTTNAGRNESSPFHGYYFRIVTADSVSGTSSYVSDGKKRGGVALVAYPANYRSSGVKTFIVTQDGVVYEKDLGPNTTTVAPNIRARSSTWRAAE